MSISIPPKYRLRVKQRQRVVAYARTHDIKPASRHFGPFSMTAARPRQSVRVGGAGISRGGGQGSFVARAAYPAVQTTPSSVW
jgi:hypothetical protein